MIVYFADRNFNVISIASSELETGNVVIEDTLTDDVQTGTRTIELILNDNQDVRTNVTCGRYILCGGHEADFDTKEEKQFKQPEYALYQIVNVERDADKAEITIYGEDIGIDLLNKTVGSWKPETDQTITSAVDSVLGSSHMGWNVNYNVDKKKKKDSSRFSYESDSTALERLQSVLSIFNAEMYFSYDIDGFKAITRSINVVDHHGRKTPVHDFRMGAEISNITETASIEELATSYKLYGLNSKSAKTALSKMPDYKNYSGKTYKPDDRSTFDFSRNHTYKISGDQVQATDAMKKWRNELDTDGNITVVKETQYKNVKSLISYAMKELEKVADVEYTYEVEFNDIPETVHTGDYIRIIDEQGQLYLKARVLKIESSETRHEYKLTLGSFKRLEGSKAEINRNAAQGADGEDAILLQIDSVNGTQFKNTGVSTTLTVTIRYGDKIITKAADMLENFGSAAYLTWSEKKLGETEFTALASDDSRIGDSGFYLTLGTGDVDEKSVFECELNF